MSNAITDSHYLSLNIFVHYPQFYLLLLILWSITFCFFVVGIFLLWTQIFALIFTILDISIHYTILFCKNIGWLSLQLIWKITYQIVNLERWFINK